MLRASFLLLCLSPFFATAQTPEPPLRVAIAGLNHGHVDGFLRGISKRTDVQLVGVFDPEKSLHVRYATKYGLKSDLFYTDLATMLDRTKPEAVASFTSTYEHPAIVKAAAQRHIDVMMEKPMAVSMDHARQIQRDAAAGGIQVIVNYETTWYKSHAELRRFLDGKGEIRKMVAMDGHQGPQEIHVGPEFFAWLTDPIKNGAGALFDFGCYGANLMTWMMDNQRPVAVTAITQTDKPRIYQHVDDEATVLVEYPQAQGIIQGSWNWPFARKDFEVYTSEASAVATGGEILHTRAKGDAQEALHTAPPLVPDEADSVSYLKAVVRKRIKPTGLSSLQNNMIVVEILDAARQSAKTGKTIRLQ
jgi:predicted dehydrogenase